MQAISHGAVKTPGETLTQAWAPESWADTIGTLVQRYAGEGPRIGPAERAYAEEAFRNLAHDTQLSIREALAQSVKAVRDLPREIALSLAEDAEPVALPMLKDSQALTDDDLAQMLRGGSAAKQIAIAHRRRLSAALCHAVIDTGNETAVARLVANDGAALEEAHLQRILEEYQASDPVFDALARRPDLPNSIYEALVSTQNARLRDYLADERELPLDRASDLVLQTRERATISVLRTGSARDEAEDLVKRLHAGGRLTPPIIIRALCVGDLPFFEAAMAELARVPLQNARLLIHDRGPEGLESLYLRTGMSERLFPAFRAAVRLIPEIQYDGGAHDRERFVSRMIERMLTQFEDPALKMPAEDIDYLMSKLTHLVA